jgi:hypothetical protein
MPSMAISARKYRADDCMDAAVRRPEGRAMHGAMHGAIADMCRLLSEKVGIGVRLMAILTARLVKM